MGLEWKERLEIQKEDQGIVIFKEGMFARMYEEGAWRFVNQIRSLKCSVRRIKKLGRDVVYCGLPITSLKPLGLELESIDVEKQCWRVNAKAQCPEDFEEWRRLQQRVSIVAAQSVLQSGEPAAAGTPPILDFHQRVVSIDVASLSPLEALTCLYTLRQEALMEISQKITLRKEEMD